MKILKLRHTVLAHSFQPSAWSSGTMARLTRANRRGRVRGRCGLTGGRLGTMSSC
jgi:hypothetical protein